MITVLRRAPLRSALLPFARTTTTTTTRSMGCTSRRAAPLHDNDDIPAWASDDARTALQGFRARFTGTHDGAGLVSEYTQTLDANQIYLLRVTQASMLPLGARRLDDGNEDEAQLRSREEALLTSPGVQQHGVRPGSALVPTEHLAFFTPRIASSILGADGSDASFNPPGGLFTRRMWAGGQMEWRRTVGATAFAEDEGLRVGDTAWERTYVEKADVKQLAGGRGEMIVVWVRKEFGSKAHGDRPMLVDRRSWVFQRGLPTDGSAAASAGTMQAFFDKHSRAQDHTLSPPAEALQPTLQRRSAADLFRYSALTFNAHAIHLSPPWAQHVEGHPNIVVHGPLNLSLLVRKWGREVAGWHFDDKQADFKCARTLRSVEYRAKRPVYAEQPYWLALRPPTSSSSSSSSSSEQDVERQTVVALHADGQVAMEAHITSSL